MAVPYIFASTATGNVQASEIDANFAAILAGTAGALLAPSLGVNGALYSGTKLSVNGEVYIGDPTATFQPDAAQLMVRNDASAGVTGVFRGMYAGGAASAVLLSMANSSGDQEYGFQLFNSATTDATFGGTRSGLLYVNYGDFGIWTQYQSPATPVNNLTIAGQNRTHPGFVSINPGTATANLVRNVPYTLTVSSPSTGNTTFGLFRNNAGSYDFGLIATLTGATGDASLVASGGGLYVSGTSGVVVQSVTPNTQTGATYSVAINDTYIIANRAGTVTLTLPDPTIAASIGRPLWIRTIQNQTVVSASSNVVPLAGGSAATGILSNTAGKWALLVADGTNWLITASN